MAGETSEWQHSVAVPGVYSPRQGYITGAPTDPIVAANVAALLERSRVGQAKYGCTLESLSARDGIAHALEEALDLANYLRGVLMRMDGQGGSDGV